MPQRHRDFFKELEHCIARSKTRGENLEALNARYKRVRIQQSSEARLEQALLDQAKKVFGSDTSYQEYLAELDSEGNAYTQAEYEQAQLRAAEARLQARQAEAAKRREDKRAETLQRTLDAERRRREEAERQAQLRAQEAKRAQQLQRTLDAEREQREEAERQAQRASEQGGWGALAKGILEGLAAWSETGNRAAAPPRPEAVADLTGDWCAPDGHTCRIRQNRNAVQIQLWDPWGRPVADSSGTFDGRFVEVNFTTVPIPTMLGFVPTRGVASLQLLNGGYTLQGRSVNHVTGQEAPILLHRVS
jgi:hypothetical protein